MAPRKKPTKIEIPDTITGNSELDKRLIAFPEQTNLEAIDTALLLQQLVRGQSAMLNNQERFGEEIRKLKERMGAYDEAAARFESNREKFIQEVIEKSESLQRTGAARDKIVAKGTLQFEEEMKIQRANLATEQLAFEQAIAGGPKVTVTSPGKLETLVVAGRNVPTIVPEEIRIKHKTWVLQPGVPTEVPKMVAEALQQRRRIEQENDARSNALQKNMNNDALIKEMKDIDKKFGIHHKEE